MLPRDPEVSPGPPASRLSPELMLDALRSLPTAGNEMRLPELRALLVLATEGPQAVAALANALALDAPTTESIGASLVTRGLVVRIPSDSGAIIVALSTGGRRRIDDVMWRQPPAVERLRPTG